MSNADREKWESRYANSVDVPNAPSVLLTSLVDLLPAGGRALDVAGGGGRHAIWLAQQGFETTIADISPKGLAIARERARVAGVPLTDVCIDFDHDPFPAGPWDVIVSFCFLKREMFPAMMSVLAPGGLLIYCQPTQKNLERHAKPPADFLLDEGELTRLVSGAEIVRYREGWLEDDRHDAIVVARRREYDPSRT